MNFQICAREILNEVVDPNKLRLSKNLQMTFEAVVRDVMKDLSLMGRMII